VRTLQRVCPFLKMRLPQGRSLRPNNRCCRDQLDHKNPTNHTSNSRPAQQMFVTVVNFAKACLCCLATLSSSSENISMSQQHQSRQLQQTQLLFAVKRLTALYDDVGDQRTVVRARDAQDADGCRSAAAGED
jgi:hypothetical protein